LIQEIAMKFERATTTRTEETTNEWIHWVEDIRESVRNGHTLTRGRTLTLESDANDTGQRYHGPVVLLTDALSYSAADIFAAGFQDHAIGPILSSDESTGGGGANRWLHEEFFEKLRGIPGLPLEELTSGAKLGVAIRRSTRVGPNNGVALEDTGARRSVEHRVTRADILDNDRDLFEEACARLAVLPSFQLRILGVERGESALTLTVSSRNLDRLEVHVDGFPQCAAAAGGGEQVLVVPLGGIPAAPAGVEVRGFVAEGGSLRLAASALRFLEE
jgi:hypothetical protein